MLTVLCRRLIWLGSMLPRKVALLIIGLIVDGAKPFLLENLEVLLLILERLDICRVRIDSYLAASTNDFLLVLTGD